MPDRVDEIREKSEEVTHHKWHSIGMFIYQKEDGTWYYRDRDDGDRWPIKDLTFIAVLDHVAYQDMMLSGMAGNSDGYQMDAIRYKEKCADLQRQVSVEKGEAASQRRLREGWEKNCDAACVERDALQRQVEDIPVCEDHWEEAFTEHNCLMCETQNWVAKCASMERVVGELLQESDRVPEVQDCDHEEELEDWASRADKALTIISERCRSVLPDSALTGTEEEE